MAPITLTSPGQVIRTDGEAHELCAEKELSAYSRFTRAKYGTYDPTVLIPAKADSLQAMASS